MAEVTLAQQEADIQRICQVLSLRRDEWPVRAEAAAGRPPPDDVLRRWLALRDTAVFRPYEIIRLLRWGVVQPGIWLVCCLASRLDGWRWDVKGEYPRESALCFRRALIATRGVTEHDALWQRARDVLRRSRRA